MILVSHALIGAAVANIFLSHPVIAPLAAFISHFVVDITPHWHYQLFSLSKNKLNPLDGDMLPGKHFVTDIARVGFDALLGVTLSFLLFRPEDAYSTLIIYTGAVCGILPDALQFAYWKFRVEPLIMLERFHIWAHSKILLDDYTILGPLLQIAVVVIIFYASIVIAI